MINLSTKMNMIFMCFPEEIQYTVESKTQRLNDVEKSLSLICMYVSIICFYIRAYTNRYYVIKSGKLK